MDEHQGWTRRSPATDHGRRPNWVTREFGGEPVIGEFRAFLLKTNALALAIGVIIGGALGTVVNSLVNDIIMPPVGLVLGGVDFSKAAIHLKNATTDAAGNPVPGIDIRYGAFINAIIAFVVIAFVVWQISRSLIKEPPPAEVKTCPFCKEANAPDASKCRACASAI
jgi:large conductance mechanosensitive channel